jgi:hypothetical protein
MPFTALARELYLEALAVQPPSHRITHGVEPRVRYPNVIR